MKTTYIATNNKPSGKTSQASCTQKKAESSYINQTCFLTVILNKNKKKLTGEKTPVLTTIRGNTMQTPGDWYE